MYRLEYKTHSTILSFPPSFIHSITHSLISNVMFNFYFIFTFCTFKVQKRQQHQETDKMSHRFIPHWNLFHQWNCSHRRRVNGKYGGGAKEKKERDSQNGKTCNRRYVKRIYFPLRDTSIGLIVLRVSALEVSSSWRVNANLPFVSFERIFVMENELLDSYVRSWQFRLLP